MTLPAPSGILKRLYDGPKPGRAELIAVDYRTLVSRADLVYHSPAEVSIDGTPIGNGMMGTTVWTTPDSVRFHLNRRDLFSSDRNHAGSHRSPVDYRGGCARLEVDVGGEAFAAGIPSARISPCTTPSASSPATGCGCACFLSSARDLLAVEVDDRRAHPRETRVTLSMWRAPEVTTPLNLWNAKRWIPGEVETGLHTARYRFEDSGGRLLVVQEFEEKRFFRDEEYRAGSAVAVAVPGADPRVEAHEAAWKPADLFWTRSRSASPTNGRRSARGGPRRAPSFCPRENGVRTVLLSSAAGAGPDAGGTGDSSSGARTSADPDAATDPDSGATGDRSLELLDAAAGMSYETLRAEHTAWWNSFWSRSFVHLTSEDGFADYLERVRTLHLYYAASSSRGPGPAPQGAGLIFQTEGDIPHLGTQLWHWIVEMMYRPLQAADAADLCEPYFDMYSRQLPLCEEAARQRWGVASGALFPETSPADGPVSLPPESAREFRNYFLGRTGSGTLSARTRVLCQHDSHLYYSSAFDGNKEEEARRGMRPFAAIAHIVSTGSKIALHAWWRYRRTGDEAWLREKAYPLLRAAAELYRHLAVKGEDGLYHLEGTNVMESFFLVKDSLKDLAAIRGIAGPAIRAAEILGVDAGLREGWRDLLEHLAPYPMGVEPESKALTFGTLADGVWAAGHLGHIDVPGEDFPSEDVWAHPVETFEAWTLESGDGELKEMVRRMLDLCPNHRKAMTGRHWRPSLVRTPIAFPLAGRGEELPALLAAHYSMYRPFLANGLSCFEQGIQSMGLEPSGMAAGTLQQGLMQSVSPRPGEPEVIRVFPAWPQEWDASFRLLARGGFLVTAAVRKGEVEFVEVESRLGEECRLRNPWGGTCRLVEVGAWEGAAAEDAGAASDEIVLEKEGEAAGESSLERGRDAPAEVPEGAAAADGTLLAGEGAATGGTILEGDLLRFATVAGQRYRIMPQGRPEPQGRTIAPEPASGPVEYSFRLPSGVTVGNRLGRGPDEAVRGLAAYEIGNRRMRIEQAAIEREADAGG